MKEITIIIFLTLINLLGAVFAYSNQYYEVAMFICFTLGVCFMTLLANFLDRNKN